MALGDHPADAGLSAAWDAFCDNLRQAGALAFKDHNPASPLHRADAFRFLTQNLGQAFPLALETHDPAFPHIHAFTHAMRKLGSDAADFLYQQAWISGAHSYRVSGTKGSARFFNIAVQGTRHELIPGTDWPSLHEPFGDTPEANLFGHQIEAGSDGGFELIIGGEARPSNWLPLTTNSRKLFIRQGFDDWGETPWTLRIERIGMDSPRPLPLPDDIMGAMEWAGNFMTGLMRDWPDHPYQFSRGAVDPELPNQFPTVAGADGDTKRGRAVANMVWKLRPQDALIISFDPPDDAFWMASLGGVFMNSFDYIYRQTSLTPSRTAIDSDGKVRLILCAGDPGYHNWLDSCGFEQGNLGFRTMMRDYGPSIQTELVPFKALAKYLPAGSRKQSAAGRHIQMMKRFDGVLRQRLNG